MLDSLVNKLEEIRLFNGYVFANLMGIYNESVVVYDSFGSYVGYYSKPYFMKCFKKVFGYTFKDFK